MKKLLVALLSLTSMASFGMEFAVEVTPNVHPTDCSSINRQMEDLNRELWSQKVMPHGASIKVTSCQEVPTSWHENPIFKFTVVYDGAESPCTSPDLKVYKGTKRHDVPSFIFQAVFDSKANGSNGQSLGQIIFEGHKNISPQIVGMYSCLTK